VGTARSPRKQVPLDHRSAGCRRDRLADAGPMRDDEDILRNVSDTQGHPSMIRALAHTDGRAASTLTVSVDLVTTSGHPRKAGRREAQGEATAEDGGWQCERSRSNADTRSRQPHTSSSWHAMISRKCVRRWVQSKDLGHSKRSSSTVGSVAQSECVRFATLTSSASLRLSHFQPVPHLAVGGLAAPMLPHMDVHPRTHTMAASHGLKLLFAVL
jgi:hypothetical protein